MRAGDLTPGRYHAHGSKEVDCIIHEVTLQPNGYEVLIDYSYPGVKRYQSYYHVDRNWGVEREQMIVEEPLDWVSLLKESLA